MAKFSEDSKCPKCGGQARTLYDEATDRLRRDCLCCGYIWYESPLDRREVNNGKE